MQSLRGSEKSKDVAEWRETTNDNNDNNDTNDLNDKRQTTLGTNDFKDASIVVKVLEVVGRWCRLSFVTKVIGVVIVVCRFPLMLSQSL